MSLVKSWSRPGMLLLLGAAACAVCCALPLAAVLIGGGVVTTAMVLEPLAAVLVATGVVIAGVVYVRRRRGRAAPAASCATGEACSIDRSCGCGTLPTQRARAVGCTLSDAELPGRGDEFRRMFRALKDRHASDTRAVWIFAWSPELEREARALAQAEQGCCSFWRFDVQRVGDDLRWEATVPPDRRDAIKLLDDIARESMTSSSRA